MGANCVPSYIGGKATFVRAFWGAEKYKHLEGVDLSGMEKFYFVPGRWLTVRTASRWGADAGSGGGGGEK